jgi:enoyl-CoA hydratase/carnithine racemase
LKADASEDDQPMSEGGQMSTSGLVVERSGPVGWIAFDRPRHANAMDGAMLARLPGVWRELDADPAIGAIVVTGTGTTFQTGLDMTALARDPASLREATRLTSEMRLELTGRHAGIRTPVIAAVNGVCAGGGLHFVVDADIVIAATTATFLDPHVSVGQVSALEAIGLSSRIAAPVAARLVLAGRHERLTASRALQIGLVSEVVEPDRLRQRAQRLGEVIASQDRERLRAVKSALWAAMELGRTAALELVTAGEQ